MISISVCMIVKDEEKVLARCLDSLAGIADEIIIVDTGSQDATKQIAAAYTDHIYDFAWVYDFSAARNYSFSKATKEYIYVADADEVIQEGERQKFLKLKEELDPRVEIVQMLYTNQLSYNTTYNFDEELRPKLYRRLRSFFWEEPLHEAVRLAPVILDTDIRIRHMPTSKHAGRDFAAFERAYQRDGLLSKRLSEMYARELLIAGEEAAFLRAVPFFENQCEGTTDAVLLRQALCVLVRAGRLLGDTDLFFKYALKAMAAGDAPSEVCFEIGEYYFNRGDFNKKDIYEAALWYYNAIYEAQPELNIKMAGSLPAGRLVECYEGLGEREAAAQYRAVLADFIGAAK
ncbi:MAG: glycosyltransferase family 2 protein [Lachnospiraceae bacterium]|nr:glycosyltransferase family 2 protein [Lachnospiraceae bacterium]